jgi:ComF family protein
VILDLANAVVRVMLGSLCPGCKCRLEQPLSGMVCPACIQSFEPVEPPSCRICGDRLAGVEALDDVCRHCDLAPPSYSQARGAGVYQGPLREVIHAFKYEGRRLLAEPLADVMRLRIPDVLAGARAAVPVPLHPLRSLRRGFNQADDLAVRLRIPVARALRRVRHGTPQASLDADKRRRSLEAEFDLALRYRCGRRLARDLQGACLVLVDDVMTTGATLDACGRVLLQAGAAEVRAVTVARALAGRPPARLPRPDPSTARRR